MPKTAIVLAVSPFVAVALALFNPWLCLVVLAAFTLAGFLLRWPDLATLAVFFILYANLAVVASKFHGVPQVFAGSFLLLLCLPLVNYLLIRRQKIIIDRPLRWMFGFLLVALTSALFAADWSESASWIGTYLLEGVVLYFLIINVVRNVATLRRAVWALVLAGSFMGFFVAVSEVTQSFDSDLAGLAQRDTSRGVDQVQSNGVHLLRTREKVRTSHRAEGTIGEPNRFAQVMLVVLPLALFRFWNESSPLLRLGAAGAGFLIAGGAMLSYSRGGFLALAMMVGLLVSLGYVRLKHAVAGALVGMLLVAVVAPGYVLRMSSIRGVEQLFAPDSAVDADGATRGRMTEMLSALMVFLDYPVLGVGPGQYAPYYSIDYQANPDIAFRNIQESRRAHSLYLEVAAELGAVGLGTLLAIVYMVSRRLWRVRRECMERHPRLAHFATGFWFSLVAYMGTAMFLHLSYQRYFWMILALSAAAVRVLEQEIRHDAGTGSEFATLDGVAVSA